MEKEFITLESGLRIHYKEFGKGPTMLLLHGWNNDWSGFMPLIAYLKDRFHVIAIDLPGYGKSDPLRENYTVERLSDTLCDFIKHKNGKKIDILCALSMGTVIAADLSNRHSEMIKSVVLIGPPIIKYDWLPSKFYREWMRIMNSSSVLMKAGHRVLASPWYGHFTAKHINMYKYDRDLINEHGMKGRKNTNPRVLFQMGKAMYHYHLEKTLKKIKIPTLIILGRHDKIVNLNEAGKIGDNKKNVMTKWIEEAGHVVSLEKPKETSEVLFEFAEKTNIL